MTVEKTTTEYGQTVSTVKAPEKWTSRMLEIRDKDGVFIATLSQSYNGTVILVSGEGYELKESK